MGQDAKERDCCRQVKLCKRHLNRGNMIRDIKGYNFFLLSEELWGLPERYKGTEDGNLESA